MSKKAVHIVTITYGNRWHLLQKVLKSLLEIEAVIKIIVVNNAAPYDVEEKVSALSKTKIKVINLAENTGSAMGYKVGLKTAFDDSNCEFIYLLDDDNKPVGKAIETLLNYYQQIAQNNAKKETHFALASLREDRKKLVKIAKGIPASRFFFRKNAFNGYNIFDIPLNQFHKWKAKKYLKNAIYLDKVVVPFVPYGGLFFHRDMIDKIGLPDERFYLYADDSEYTYRITKSEGKIWLIPKSQLEDIDKSWNVTVKKSWFQDPVLEQGDFRSYYNLRNRTYFLHQNQKGSPFLNCLNRHLYIAYLWILATFQGKKPQFQLAFRAIQDGLKGQLGKVDFENIIHKN